MALRFWLLLSLLWGRGHGFELQEAIEELQSENLQLQGKVQNLTEALSELKLFIWNRSQDTDSSAEHLLHEHVPCHQDAHWQKSAAAPCLVSSSLWLLAVTFLLALWSKAITWKTRTYTCNFGD